MATGRPITSDESAVPYRLHAILRDYQIKQSELRQRIPATAGVHKDQPMASSTISELLTRRVWPTTVDPDLIRARVAEVLAERGVPDEVAGEAWEVDGELPPEPERKNPADKPAEKTAALPEIPLPEPEMLSPTAREHFHLARHPFIDDVQGPQDVYLSAGQRYIRESMYYAAKHGGFVAVIGESGSGKTTLRRDLVDRIYREDEPIRLIQPQNFDKTTLTAAHICDAIIADTSLERPKLSLEAKARQVQRILADSSRAGATHALMIEEAHDLSVPTLKYLKRFWEMEDGFRKLLGIILVGQPELGHKLDERRNPGAREVIRRCEIATLKPLNGNLEEYLQLKLKRIGSGTDALFEADAFDAIRARLTQHDQRTGQVISQLYPLVVQNLVVKCLNQCVELGLPKVSAELVGRI
jgi:type II secretory pathway predicted ATPase ExeA